MEKKFKNVYAICYDTLYVFKNKKDAKKYFSDCYYMSDGAEQERYASILVDLNFSNIGKDSVSNSCRQIVINQKEDIFLNINLKDSLLIEKVIAYYEKVIEPILDISNNHYGIDFNSKIPFENFSSDEDSYNMSSFSEYYQEILKVLNVNINNICTESVSDGKYEMNIDNDLIDVRAWDKLEDILDNINTIKELKKEKEIEK